MEVYVALSLAALRLEGSHWSTSIMCKVSGQKIVAGKTSFYLLSFTTDSWFKFVKR